MKGGLHKQIELEVSNGSERKGVHTVAGGADRGFGSIKKVVG